MKHIVSIQHVNIYFMLLCYFNKQVTSKFRPYYTNTYTELLRADIQFFERNWNIQQMTLGGL